MNEEYYNVGAIFWKIDGITYRDNTKIIFGDNDKKCIGVVLMLNPGSCNARDESDIKEYKQTFRFKGANYLRLKRDSTQGKVAKCVKTAYNNHQLSRYVFIVNLSNRREPKQENLSKKDFTKSAEDIIKELEVENKKQENEIRWIWIAFGKKYKGKDKEYITELQDEIVKKLNEHELFKYKIIGKSVQYIHPGQGFRGDNRESIIREIGQKSHNSAI